MIASLLFLLFSGCFAATVILYVVAWYDYVNLQCTPDECSWRENLPLFGMLKGIFLESLSCFFLILTYPLYPIFDRLPRSPGPDTRPPVLFVHAWGSASHSFLFARLRLMSLGFRNLYAITYRPVTGDAARLAGQVARRIDEVLEETGAERLILITHSMGGVLSRYAVKNLGANGKVEKVIALGGPHMGSRVAVFMPTGVNTLQMTYDSAFVRELAEGGMTPGDAKYVSVYSAFDHMVLPQHSSDLGPGAKNIQVPFHGHTYLVYSPAVLKVIAGEVKEYC